MEYALYSLVVGISISNALASIGVGAGGSFRKLRDPELKFLLGGALAGVLGLDERLFMYLEDVDICK